MGVPSEEVEGEMPAKKGRLDQDNHAQAPKSASENAIQPVISNMSDYTITELLGQSDDGKVVFTRGVISGLEGPAVVLFETNSINLERVKLFLSDKSVVKLTMNNDIFNIFQLDPPAGTNSIKTTVIHPATQKLINKFTTKPSYFVTETPHIYQTITKPYILNHLGDHKWVYNILEGRAEQDRILCKNEDEKEGFVLAADLKWDMTTVENMYCLAIVKRRDIYSIRDLNQSHLPMLRNLQETCLATIKEKFGIPRSLVRVYFHYQPAYYHLHIHFAHLRYQAGAPVIGKSVAVNDVLQNIALSSEYYKNATLVYYIKDGHALSVELDKHKLIERE